MEQEDDIISIIKQEDDIVSIIKLEDDIKSIIKSFDVVPKQIVVKITYKITYQFKIVCMFI